LADCLRVALERNPLTRSSWQASRSAAARVGEARAAHLPAATFTSGASRADSVALDNRNETGPANTFDAGFGVRYLLFDGGVRRAGVREAEAGLLAANFRHSTTLQDLALQVEEAYYELLASKWFLAVAKQAVKQTQYHVEVARARQKSGVAPRSDVLRAETEEADADLTLVRARSGVQINRGRLARAMGIRVSRAFQIADLPENIHERELADIERLLDEAIENRAERQASRAMIRARRSSLRAAQSGYWPTVTADVGYGWRDRTFMPDREEWSAGVSVNLPIFTGFERRYHVRRAEADLGRATAEHERLARDIELDVWTAHSRVLESNEAIEAAKKLVASAEEGVRVAEGEYKAGAGAIIELIDAQTAATTAGIRLVQARLDWYLAMARVERAVGRTLATRSPDAAGRKAGP